MLKDEFVEADREEIMRDPRGHSLELFYSDFDERLLQDVL